MKKTAKKKPRTGPPILESATIKRFGLFSDEKLEFSPGINVIIGRNGCGKSHLLKLLYTLVKECGTPAGKNSALVSEKLEHRLERKLAGVFRPEDDNIRRLIQFGVSRETAEVSATFTNRKSCGFTLGLRRGMSKSSGDVGPLKDAVFLPSREVLALYEGFMAAYQNRELSFDETFYDLCLALSATPLRSGSGDLPANLVEPLEVETRGKIRRSGGRFYLRNEGHLIEAHLVSEGWRKLASLARLISNGTLTKNSFLFWDEPEANLNPMMIKEISDTLLRLANQGVQIFVVSHDYLLTTRLSLASEYQEEIPEDQRCEVKFFGLARRPDEKGVIVRSGSKLADLQDNPILAEYAALYDYEGGLFEKNHAPE